MRIVEQFHGLPVRIEFDYFPEISDRMRNIVLLGASSRSDVSREVAAELYEWGIRVRGDGEHAHFEDNQGQHFRCEHVEVEGKAIVSKDVGVIFRRTTESGSTVLMCGGIHTFGSLAATEVALSRDFQRKVRRHKLEEFIQFVTVDVIIAGERAGLGIMRQSIRWEKLPLIDVSKLA